jgi:hypothetical protein
MIFTAKRLFSRPLETPLSVAFLNSRYLNKKCNNTLYIVIKLGFGILLFTIVVERSFIFKKEKTNAV